MLNRDRTEHETDIEVFDDGGEVQRRIFLGTEMTGTFDQDEIAKMALQDVIVVPTGWGQNVYQVIRELLSDDIMPSDD